MFAGIWHVGSIKDLEWALGLLRDVYTYPDWLRLFGGGRVFGWAFSTFWQVQGSGLQEVGSEVQ